MRRQGADAPSAKRQAHVVCIGKHEWAPGELERDIREGLYRPAACSRGVALKQCLGLPKPLWHEVMEMLGGTSEEISKLELQRRKDS